MDKKTLESLIRRVLLEELGQRAHGVKKLALPEETVTEANRLDTGRPGDFVYTKDLFTLEESPRLGVGLMVMERTTFPWTLNYDEVDYVIEGRLDILIGGDRVSAGPGEVIFIPKGSAIEFSAPERARFLYVTYPADWQSQG